MLDLLLALVRTPIGCSVLVAAAAALAVAWSPRLSASFAFAAVILAGPAYVASIQSELGTARRERDEAKADAAGFVVDLRDAHADCRDRLRAVRGLVGEKP